MSVGSSTGGVLDGNGLTNVAQTIFDGEVKHAFQSAGVLRGTTTVRNDVTGDTYKFRKMGKGLANQKTSSADVMPMNVTHELISCSLANWNAPEYTDIFDAKEVNFDEKTELQQVIAGALGRRYDQLIIDALDAASSTNVVAGGITLSALIDASEALNDNGVPSGGRHIALTAAGLSGLLGNTSVTSSDFNNVKALVSGEINTFMGFNFHVIETRAEGGLSVSGYAWHDSAVGVAIGLEVSAKVDWVPQKTSWLCNGLMKAGAVARDETGIVEFT